MTPEALDGDTIGKIRDGDLIRLATNAGLLEVLVPRSELAAHAAPDIEPSGNEPYFSRELFAGFRQMVGRAD
jgi:phosphogluconate dehydratase